MKKKHLITLLIVCTLLLSAGGLYAFHSLHPDSLSSLYSNIRLKATAIIASFSESDEQTANASETEADEPSESSEVTLNASQNNLPYGSFSVYQTPITYYCQTNPEWTSYLYGGRDPIGKYGCGPTAMAMIVTSLTDEEIKPPDMADWAAEHGYWSPGGGSMHSLIPEGAAAFGLECEAFTDFTAEAIRAALYDGKVLVFLLGPGYFTESGHFIILNGVASDGRIIVADPASYKNTSLTWEPDFLVSQLSPATDNGSPAWAVCVSQ